jgi:two-component system chemotaxis response regulator CheV
MSSLLVDIDRRTQMVGHNRMELLLFRLRDNQRFGINVFKVQEVIKCPKLTVIPHSNIAIAGVATMRGKTISLMDLGMAVGYPPVTRKENCYVIIAEYNRSVHGFLVNSVDHIVNKNWDDIQPPPKGSGHSSYVTAVTRVDDELVEILDVEKVLTEVIGQPDTIQNEKLFNQARDNMEVLVVDDSTVARNQCKRTLEQVGVKCTLANNGKEAYELLENMLARGESVQDRFVMIISDLEMPEMDGYTFTAKVRANTQIQEMHILLHTSLSGVFNEKLVAKVGADEFLAKFNPDELALAVLRQAGKDQVVA